MLMHHVYQALLDGGRAAASWLMLGVSTLNTDGSCVCCCQGNTPGCCPRHERPSSVHPSLSHGYPLMGGWIAPFKLDSHSTRTETREVVEFFRAAKAVEATPAGACYWTSSRRSERILTECGSRSAVATRPRSGLRVALKGRHNVQIMSIEGAVETLGIDTTPRSSALLAVARLACGCLTRSGSSKSPAWIKPTDLIP